MHIYNWYHSITTSIPLCTRYEDRYVHKHLFSFSPLAPLAPLFGPLQLTWNPPRCDRIRPPRSQVARKLLRYFPPLAHIPPLPKIPTPRGFPDLNIHSLGRHCEPNPQSSLSINKIQNRTYFPPLNCGPVLMYSITIWYQKPRSGAGRNDVK